MQQIQLLITLWIKEDVRKLTRAFVNHINKNPFRIRFKLKFKKNKKKNQKRNKEKIFFVQWNECSPYNTKHIHLSYTVYNEIQTDTCDSKIVFDIRYFAWMWEYVFFRFRSEIKCNVFFIYEIGAFSGRYFKQQRAKLILVTTCVRRYSKHTFWPKKFSWIRKIVFVVLLLNWITALWMHKKYVNCRFWLNIAQSKEWNRFSMRWPYGIAHRANLLHTFDWKYHLKNNLVHW